MIIDANQIFCGNYFTIYANIKSLETNKILDEKYVNENKQIINE